MGSDRGSQEGVGTSQSADEASRQTEWNANKDKLHGVADFGVSLMCSTVACVVMASLSAGGQHCNSV